MTMSAGCPVHDDQALGEKRHLIRPQKLENHPRSEGRIRHHQIGAGHVQFGDVALQNGAADNLYICAQLSAIECQVNVHVVTVGGDDDRFGRFDAGRLEGVDVGRVAQDGELVVWTVRTDRALFHDPILNAVFGQGLGRNLTDPASSQNQHLGYK